MRQKDDESGLSEVIGFLLIVGLLSLIFSQYVIYVIPAIGRDNEITQMNYIKDQFSDYKITVDSLWLNNETGVTLSRSINLGSIGKTTESSSNIFPIIQPIGNGGTLSVNPTGSTPDVINVITPNGYNKTFLPFIKPPDYRINLLSSSFSSINTVPNHIFLEFNPPTITPFYYPFDILVNDSNIPPQKWDFLFNVTRAGVNVYNNNSVINKTALHPPLTDPNGFLYQNISFEKRQGTTPTKYSLDLLDIFRNFGITSQIQYPIYLYLNSNPGAANLVVDSGQSQDSSQQSATKPLNYICGSSGCTINSFSYQSQNNYWIYQQYYYQNGGVFLSQLDGGIPKILPPITISVKGDSSGNTWPYVFIPIIRINNQPSFTQNQLIGGSGPVQVLTTLVGTTRLNIPHGMPNTPKVQIQVSNSNPQSSSIRIWNSAFTEINQTMNQTNSVPDNWVSVSLSSGNTTSLNVEGPKKFPDLTYDVEMDIVVIDLNVALQPVAGRSS